MNFHSYLALAGAIIFELIGTFALQASHQFTRPLQTALSIGSFIVAMYLLSLALKTIPVGIAYSIWSGIGIILIAALSVVIFKQKIDFTAILGIALIATGAMLVNGFRV
jgi:small multidrug resistance pump